MQRCYVFSDGLPGGLQPGVKYINTGADAYTRAFNAGNLHAYLAELDRSPSCIQRHAIRLCYRQPNQWYINGTPLGRPCKYGTKCTNLGRGCMFAHANELCKFNGRCTRRSTCVAIHTD